MKVYPIVTVRTENGKKYRSPVGVLLEREVDGQKQMRLKLHMYPDTAFLVLDAKENDIEEV